MADVKAGPSIARRCRPGHHGRTSPSAATCCAEGPIEYQRRPPGDEAQGAQHRRPADPGRVRISTSSRSTARSSSTARRPSGMRLDIPAATAIRFEPGDQKEVTLVPYGGKQRVYGFNNLVDGPTATARHADAANAKAIALAAKRGFRLVRVRRAEPASASNDSQRTLHGNASRAASTPTCSAPPSATRSASATPDSVHRDRAGPARSRRRGRLYGGGKTPARRHGHGQPAHQRRRRASTWSSPT